MVLHPSLIFFFIFLSLLFRCWEYMFLLIQLFVPSAIHQTFFTIIVLEALNFIMRLKKWVRYCLFSEGTHCVNTRAVKKKKQHLEVKLKSGEEDPENLLYQWEVSEGFTDKLIITLSLEGDICSSFRQTRGMSTLGWDSREGNVGWDYKVSVFMKLQIFLNIWPTIHCRGWKVEHELSQVGNSQINKDSYIVVTKLKFNSEIIGSKCRFYVPLRMQLCRL